MIQKCKPAWGKRELFVSLPAIGQERGQYIPGTGGLNSGLQTPEGFTYANVFIWYPATKFKDQNGDTAPIDFDLDLFRTFIHARLGDDSILRNDQKEIL